ncbi:MAG TPA: carbohydrate ABC transporter permease [Acidimicrobiia bacterium]|nr:carbohydrate ABC transporter permease [Acidimicrobiia bacterium]
MRIRSSQATLHLLLLVGGFVILLPLLWMLTTSLKSPGQVHLPPYLFPQSFEWSNYQKAFAADEFSRFYLNSAVMTGGIVAGQVVLSSMAGYAFARLRFPGRNVLFGLVLATMMMPVYVTLVPSFLIVKTLGWLDSYTGLIAPRLVSPFGIFLMRQYYLSLSSDLEQAALIDGASRFRVWWSIALPLSVPALATVGIFAFLFAWNDLLWPLIITTDPDLRTVQLGLAMFTGRYGTQWTLLAAGSLIATLPAIIAFLFGQRWLIRGVSMQSTK